MTRALPLFILIGVLSACATPAIHERALTPKSTTAQTAPPPCRAPEHLVRDLTVRWAVRRYLVGPCPGSKESSLAAEHEPTSPDTGLDLTNTEIRDP
ncbi:MAG: hypothetical protein ACREYE_01930 [Gammaproteobacteria bacterium]